MDTSIKSSEDSLKSMDVTCNLQCGIVTQTCPSDYPFKFAPGCPIGNWNTKAGKGCYKQQSEVDNCSGASGSWCVFSAYKNDGTPMNGGSLKEQLEQGFGSVCTSSGKLPGSSTCTEAELTTLSECTKSVTENADTSMSDKSKMCPLYQSIFACYPACYCDDPNMKAAMDTSIKSSEDSLKSMDVTCNLQCGIVTQTCPSDYPFKFAAGCPIGNWNTKAGKGCYKQQSEVDGCSGVSGSWCVFSTYKNDDTTMNGGSLKEQLAQGNTNVPAPAPTSTGSGGGSSSTTPGSSGGTSMTPSTSGGGGSSSTPTPSYTCPSDYPFKFAAGCPIGSRNTKAGKGCYKQQSEVDNCSGASGSWCVFSAYENDDTTMNGGSLKEQLEKGFGSVCGDSTSSGELPGSSTCTEAELTTFSECTKSVTENAGTLSPSQMCPH